VYKGNIYIHTKSELLQKRVRSLTSNGTRLNTMYLSGKVLSRYRPSSFKLLRCDRISV
jgi:hypothetical protein